MSRHFLDIPYRSKDAAGELSAGFDGAVKRSYVEASIELIAVSARLPPATMAGASGSTGVAIIDTARPLHTMESVPLQRKKIKRHEKW